MYLLTHGIAKIVLVVGVLRGQLWAYPWMIALLSVFIVYQVYRLSYRLSIGLLLLTLFDVFVVVSTRARIPSKTNVNRGLYGVVAALELPFCVPHLAHTEAGVAPVGPCCPWFGPS